MHCPMQYDSTSLNSVVDCNHACDIEDISNLLAFSHFRENYLDTEPRVNKSCKIYHLLSKRNRDGNNVHHLNVEFGDEDDSLSLVPNVLASIQNYRFRAMLARRHTIPIRFTPCQSCMRYFAVGKCHNCTNTDV